MFIGEMKWIDKSAFLSLLLLFCFWPTPSRARGQATIGTHSAEINLAVTATDGSYAIGGAGIEGRQGDARKAQAFGVGGADVVLIEDVDHRRAHHSRVPSGAQEAERQRGQHDVRGRAEAAHGKPAKTSSEDIEQQ